MLHFGVGGGKSKVSVLISSREVVENVKEHFFFYDLPYAFSPASLFSTEQSSP